MKNFFSIIGGMGTTATESYIHLLNQRTPAHRDQDYLNYLLVNHATVPDRTDYILDHQKPSPLPDLIEDIQQQSQLHPDFFTLPCNTAHYFYDQLQSQTNVPILHMPREAVASIKHRYPTAKRVGLIATNGTLHDGVYDHEIEAAGFEVVKPTSAIKNETMNLIYHDIKERDVVDEARYHHILDQMVTELKSDVVILGCTELSVAEERAGNHAYPIVDAQSVLVDRTIEMAETLKRNRNNN
ncbi:aspartate/glutamate racemase family protein [Lactobacillus sp. Sy-1]|uniref:aspartate/glutamate racemase family protein n=1 Tax=Lactobacillus sp. Sy-1 TaxID=2109645 RepID=UPI001C5817F2|nr:amino acid racemase [Lactobacillus sp. Sy-1]MBW1605722.1 amino acid racemase [Lactobacillus sp. Sy-1]